MGVFTLVSGIIPQITEWHDDEGPAREVFDGIPGPLQVAFYTVIPAMLVWGAFAFADRVRNWERGAPDRRRTTPEERQAPPRRLPRRRVHAHPAARLRGRADALDDLLRVPRPARRHDRARGRPPAAGDLKFLHGRTYLAYSFFGDFAGVVFLVGIVWAIVRRYVQRPYRIRIKTKPEHALILGTFFVIGAQRLLRRGVPHRRSSSGRATRSGASSATR